MATPTLQEGEQAPGKPPRVVFVVGAPHSGKSTHCANISDHYGATVLSIADLIKQEIKKQSSTGKRIEAAQKNGDLPDAPTICQLLVDGITSNMKSPKDVFLLPGFPKTLEQATMFEKLYGEPIFMLYLTLPRSHIFDRRMLDHLKTQAGQQVDKKSVEALIDEQIDTFENVVNELTRRYKRRGLLKEQSSLGTKASVKGALIMQFAELYSAIPVTVATSFAHLHDLLFQDSWNPAYHKHRSSEVYRGLPNKNWSLKTSLMRLGIGDNVKHGAQVEQALLRNFKRYAYGSQGNNATVWEWLALMQHHGAPTRLLDWSYSPYVALHFATCIERSFDDIDGVVYCVNNHKTLDYLPNTFSSKLKAEKSRLFTCEQLDASIRDEFKVPKNESVKLDHFTSIAMKGNGKTGDAALVFLEPPSLDARLVNQFGLFSILSEPTMHLNDWFEDHPDVIRKVIIPAWLKQEVRDVLDNMNITERVLFPGLDGLSQWLRRRYLEVPPPVFDPLQEEAARLKSAQELESLRMENLQLRKKLKSKTAAEEEN